VHPELDYTGSVLGAAAEADVLLLLTEWPEFSAADPEVLAKTVARRAVVDARHALDADAWRAHGWDYRAPGRPAAGLAAAVTLAPGTRDAGAPGAGPQDAGPRDAGPRDAGPRDAERHAAEVACLAAAI
jgi:UDPglucose 6-dehydrogenase